MNPTSGILMMAQPIVAKLLMLSEWENGILCLPSQTQRHVCKRGEIAPLCEHQCEKKMCLVSCVLEEECVDLPWPPCMVAVIQYDLVTWLVVGNWKNWEKAGENKIKIISKK